ncbi:MAG: RlmE family RNA methyltransferase [Candidatus Peribacteraceae bacterium]|nr:RlmE family RNA methyltransferase [Candidatus Peribacteria bacterium]
MPKPYQPNDRWSQRAAREGYRARSAYKLLELNEKFQLFQPGYTVLDIGAAPGSWLQIAAQEVGEKGLVIGADLQPIDPVAANVRTIEQDITDYEAFLGTLREQGIHTVDLVLSDIAPNTSGIKDIDQWRSIELNQAVARIAQAILVPGGTCVMKVLRGADFDTFLCELKREWQSVRTYIAQASRDRSREIYLILQQRNARKSGKSRHGHNETSE